MNSYEGTRLGDITLCAHCGYAIQLRRFDNCVGPLGEPCSLDLWEHFRMSITPHTPAPKRAFTDFDYWLERTR